MVAQNQVQQQRRSHYHQNDIKPVGEFTLTSFYLHLPQSGAAVLDEGVRACDLMLETIRFVRAQCLRQDVSCDVVMLTTLQILLPTQIQTAAQDNDAHGANVDWHVRVSQRGVGKNGFFLRVFRVLIH